MTKHLPPLFLTVIKDTHPEIADHMPGYRNELAILLAPHFSSGTFCIGKSLTENCSFSDSTKAPCKTKQEEIHRVVNTGVLLVHFCSLERIP